MLDMRSSVGRSTVKYAVRTTSTGMPNRLSVDSYTFQGFHILADKKCVLFFMLRIRYLFVVKFIPQIYVHLTSAN